jgi:hypothetical protein
MRWYTIILLQIRDLLCSQRGQLTLLGCLVLLCLLGLLTRTAPISYDGPTLPWPWPT